MAIDRWLSPILDLARAIVAPERPERASERPPVEPYRRPLDVEDAVVVANVESQPVTVASAPIAAPTPDSDEDGEDDELPPDAAPIVSLGMARLLANQGHQHRALAMYDALIARAPGDAALAAEARTLRDTAVVVTPAPVAEDDDGLAGENEIVTVRANAKDVLVSWQVDDARIERGRKLMPDAETMAVRLVFFHRGGGREVQRDERERVVERAGEWLVRDVPVDSWLTASIGLRRNGRFVSLTHSSAARVP